MKNTTGQISSFGRFVLISIVAVCLLVNMPNKVASASLGTTYVRLSWTAPGDDMNVGQASRYDIRYSQAPILNEQNFADATQDTLEPVPLPAGSVQSATVSGLEPGVHYYFAIKTADEVPNWSVYSNVFEATTLTAADNGSGTVFISDISVTEISAASAIVNWETNIAATSEVVYGIGNLVFASWIDPQLVTTHSITLQDLAPRSDYQFRVICDDGLGNLTQSDIMIFHTPSIAAGNADGLADIIAYPNPVRFSQGEFVTFRLPDYPVDVLIQTIAGETVLLRSNISGDWQWNGQNAAGNTVAIGIYSWFVRGTDQSGKIVVKP